MWGGLDSRVSVGGEWDGRRVGGSFEAYAGQGTGLTATVPPHLVEDVQNGEVPNPLNPLGMGEGVTVEMTSEFYSGHEASAHYEALRASYGYETGTELSTAVVRMPDDTVRVVTGPSDVIRHAVSVGIGTDDFNARFRMSSELKDYQLQQTDFDMSTPEGQEAYYDTVLFGQTPAAGAEGVVDSATIDGGSYSANQDVGLKAGDLELSFLSSHYSLDDSTATHADGSSTRTMTWNDNDVGGAVTVEYDDAGNVVGTEGQIRLRGVDPNSVMGFNHAWAGEGAESGVDGDTNMVLSFNEDELTRIRGEALDLVAQRLQTDFRGADFAEQAFGTTEPTAADLAEWLPDATEQDLIILRAINGHEIASLLQSIADGDSGDVAAIRTMASLTAFADTPEELVELLQKWGIDLATADGGEVGDYDGPGSMVCVGTA